MSEVGILKVFNLWLDQRVRLLLLLLVLLLLLLLRGSRSRRRQRDFVDSDLQIDNIRACPN